MMKWRKGVVGWTIVPAGRPTAKWLQVGDRSCCVCEQTITTEQLGADGYAFCWAAGLDTEKDSTQVGVLERVVAHVGCSRFVERGDEVTVRRTR